MTTYPIDPSKKSGNDQAANTNPKSSPTVQPIRASANVATPGNDEGARFLPNQPAVGTQAASHAESPSDVMRYLGIIEENARKARKALGSSGRETTRESSDRMGSDDHVRASHTEDNETSSSRPRNPGTSVL